jgi:hypothetical protein
MAKSDYVLCRRAAWAAFKRREPFTVSAYIFRDGMRYTDPIKHPPKPTSRISYRIRVTPKPTERKPDDL